MNIEEIRNQLREELTIRPTDEQVNSQLRNRLVETLTSKQERVNQLTNELSEAQASAEESERVIAALDESFLSAPQG